jgi:hypothetical protein
LDEWEAVGLVSPIDWQGPNQWWTAHSFQALIINFGRLWHLLDIASFLWYVYFAGLCHEMKAKCTKERGDVPKDKEEKLKRKRRPKAYQKEVRFLWPLPRTVSFWFTFFLVFHFLYHLSFLPWVVRSSLRATMKVC